MNFGMDGATGLNPGAERNLLKSSSVEEGGEGGESPPPGAAMGAAWDLERQKTLRRQPKQLAASKAMSYGKNQEVPIYD